MNNMCYQYGNKKVYEQLKERGYSPKRAVKIAQSVTKTSL